MDFTDVKNVGFRFRAETIESIDESLNPTYKK